MFVLLLTDIAVYKTVNEDGEIVNFDVNHC